MATYEFQVARRRDDLDDPATRFSGNILAELLTPWTDGWRPDWYEVEGFFDGLPPTDTVDDRLGPAIAFAARPARFSVRPRKAGEQRAPRGTVWVRSVQVTA